MPELAKRVAIVSEKKTREMFDIFDADNSGAIETKELGDVMKTLGFGELTDEELDELITEFDTDKSGKMEYDEFRYLLKKYSVERGSPDDVFTAFQLFAGHTSDGRKKSFVTLEDLIQVSKDIGEWPADPIDRENQDQVDAVAHQRKTLTKRLNKILLLAPEDAGKPMDLPFNGLSLMQWKQMVASADDKHHPNAEGKESAMDAYGFHEKVTYDVYDTAEVEATGEEGEQF